MRREPFRFPFRARSDFHESMTAAALLPGSALHDLSFIRKRPYGHISQRRHTPKANMVKVRRYSLFALQLMSYARLATAAV